MGFFAGNVDLTSPGPIGSTTPNTGRFTTLTLSPSANTTPFTASGYSLTGTNAQSFFDLSGTWNTSGTPTAIKLNVTDTASNASSLLMDLQVGGSSRFSFAKNGNLTISSILTCTSINASNGAYILTGSNAFFQFNNRSKISSSSDSDISITNNAVTSSATISIESNNILSLRNSTNAQTFRLYNTYTDASNYERGFFRWSSNVLEIGAEAAGTGTQRQLRLPLGTVTASTPLSVTQTWNSAGVTFTGIQANITDTASASGSLLMDLQVGGSSKFSATKAGSLILPSGQSVRSNGANYANIVLTDGFGNGTGFLFGGYNTPTVGKLNFYMLSSGEWTLQLNLGSSISWNDNSNVVGGTRDLILTRDSSNTLAQRNSTNAQAFKLYRTFTDASNYERLGFLTTNTTRYTITSENAGTGSARSLEVSFYTAASDPTSTDITSGCFSVWKNSGTGTIKLWANDGGTMKSVALA